MKTVIIGAVAMGASCGARLKRIAPNEEVILIDKGSYASFANCGLPYFVGDEIKSKENLLLVSPAVFTNRFKIDLRLNTEVTKIDANNNQIVAKNCLTGETYTICYDNLVLAMGADAIKPNIEGIDDEDVFFLKTVDDAVSLKERAKTAKSVAVVGGGFIGLEAMENLVNQGLKVDLIEGRPSVSTLDYDMAKIVHNIIRANGVNLHLSTMVEAIKRTENGLTIKTNNGDITADIVVMAIGVKPNTSLAVDAGIELDSTRTIKVNDKLQTNFANIYAGGDLVANYEAITGNLVYVPLANYANKHGRIIANNIAGKEYTRQKISMASVFKLFNYTVASVGLGETMLDRFSIKTEAVYQNAGSHASYYPNATPIFAKLRYDKNGKIYSAQMIGENLVEKRIDILSSLLQKGCTYQDLMEVEPAYAPPYNSAKDILNFFGFMIDNVLNCGVRTITPLEIDKIKDDVFIVDVRGAAMHENGHIGNAINIPIDALRDNLDKLPKDRDIYVHCQVGLTSYNACCILRSYGYKVVNISGGYSMYSQMTKD